MYGETVTAVELTPKGTGYRAKTRFAKFKNLPELMAMFKQVADIKTADMLNLPVPEVCLLYTSRLKIKAKGALKMNELTYTMQGDYNLPDLTMPEQPEGGALPCRGLIVPDDSAAADLVPHRPVQRQRCLHILAAAQEVL